MAASRQFLKCPVCGHNVPPATFNRGALGHNLEALRQDFVPKGTGTNGGAVIWSRRAMTHAELTRVGLAAAKALESIADGLEANEIAAAFPEAVLASLEDEDAADAGQQWLAEAAAEFERRRQIVEEDRLRRRGV